MVQGNKDKLQQVTLNLISNAIKFCDAEKGKVIISLKTDDKNAILSVKDNGKGIEEGALQLIFEKFTQLSDNELGKPQGSGLGLFITKRIVELHKGKITVESEENKGANFIVELPLV